MTSFLCVKSQPKINNSQYLYFELGGVNTIYSINYEKLLNDENHWEPHFHAGFCFLGLNNMGVNTSFQFVRNNGKKWNWQLGVGAAYNKNRFLQSNVSLQGLIGKRRKFTNGYLLIAINPSLNYFPYEHYFPLAGQFFFPSIGYGYYIK